MTRGRVRRHAGKIDYETMHEDFKKPARWRGLQNLKTRAIIRFYGYPAGVSSWVGYEAARLKEAPCTHCGRTAFAEFAHAPEEKPMWHLCPGNLGKDSLGNVVPCNHGGIRNSEGEHVCTGLPSMSFHGAQRWMAIDGWEEFKKAKDE